MTLPPESLVSFRAQRLANASLIYANPAISEPINWLDQYAYMIPSRQIEPELFLSDEKIFYAERYGGSRIVTHGGGARAGLDGDYSVKGVGCNPLLGKDAENRSHAHSTGILMMAEAVRETIAANVLNEMLPYGANQTAALILSGIHSKSRVGSKTVAAALLVRKCVIRPAHFERAPYFLPRGKALLFSDVERVKAAIDLLPALMPRPVEVRQEEWLELRPVERLTQGLVELANRYAMQAATAHAHRFIHCMLTDSNVGLDGSWMDVATAFSYKTYVGGSCNSRVAALSEEHNHFVPILKNLQFSIQKYSLASDINTLPSSEALTAKFYHFYYAELFNAFLRLTGIPEQFFKACHREAEALARLLIHHARAGMKNFFIAAGPKEHGQFGANVLGMILPILACWYDHESCVARLHAHIDDRHQCAVLQQAYHSLAEGTKREAKTTISSMSSQSFRRLCVLGASKAIKDISLLRNEEIQSMLHLGLLANDEIVDTIQSVSDEGKILYSKPTECRVLCWQENNRSIFYVASVDKWHLVDNGCESYLPWQAVQQSDRLEKMRTYWGVLWKQLQERENEQLGYVEALSA